MGQDRSRRIREMALGWLEIEITGEHSERLLNLALQQGIELHHIRRYSEHKIIARLLLDDLYALRPLLAAARCRFRVRKRAGWPFLLARGRRHASLIIGSVLFALALYMVCAFIWQVEVESVYPLSAAERERVLTLAREAGLTTGSLAASLDFAAISQSMLAEASDLVFAHVERQGVKALIRVARRIDVQGEDVPLPPGDIVAVADGLIENVLVRSGTAAVRPGDTVKAGDVLVYGWGGGRLAAASAMIEARVWGEGEGEWPLLEQGLRPSGQSAGGLILRFGGDDAAPTVFVSGEKSPPYTLFTYSEQLIMPVFWRNIVLPVELIANRWYEQTPYATSYSKEQALYHARQRAASQALSHLPARCDLLSQKTLELQAGEDMVRVQVIWEARADIGEFVPLDGERLRQYEQMLAAEENGAVR